MRVCRRIDALDEVQRGELSAVIETLAAKRVSDHLTEDDLFMLLDDITAPRPPTGREIIAALTPAERAALNAIMADGRDFNTDKQRRFLAIAPWLGDPDKVMRRVEEMRSNPGGSCEYDPDS